VKANPLFDAAQEALRSVTDGAVEIGPPPGAEPLPWKDQAAQFIADLPDLLVGGPRAQEIERLHGQGSVQAYIEQMTQQIAKGRQRRRHL